MLLFVRLRLFFGAAGSEYVRTILGRMVRSLLTGFAGTWVGTEVARIVAPARYGPARRTEAGGANDIFDWIIIKIGLRLSEKGISGGRIPTFASPYKRWISTI